MSSIKPFTNRFAGRCESLELDKSTGLEPCAPATVRAGSEGWPSMMRQMIGDAGKANAQARPCESPMPAAGSSDIFAPAELSCRQELVNGGNDGPEK